MGAKTWMLVYSDGNAADWKMLRQGEDYPRLDWQIEYAGDIAGLYGVNLIDFAVLANQWQCERLWWDLVPAEGDGVIDILDLQALTENWLEGVGQ